MSAEFTNPLQLESSQTCIIISSQHPSLYGIQRDVKRIIDVVLSLIGILVFLPLMLVIAVLIKLDSPGPVLFKQKRAGLNGREFWIYKFRSMEIEAESKLHVLKPLNEIKDGGVFKMSKDPRVTRLGRILRKTSFDELPQFFNVLLGDMSMIGPRPLASYEVSQHSPYQLKRLEVMPGLSGLWQVSGRSDIDSFTKMVELDLEYINNWSLLFDIKILFKTFFTVVMAKGSY